MVPVQMSGGAVAWVDEEDYPLVAPYTWFPRKIGRTTYAMAHPTRQPFILMHRLILGAKKGELVDHRNHDGLINGRENIRLCTKTENQRNTRKSANPKTSRFKGVSWHEARHRWRAVIRDSQIGYFDSEVAAAEAYNKAAAEIFGEFAHLNEVVANA